MPNRLRITQLHLDFQALEPIQFAGSSSIGNTLRGALGMALLHGWPDLHQRVFAPKQTGGPSGLADPPRPFVLRPPLGLQRTLAGDAFHLDLHLFDLDPDLPAALIAAFVRAAETGIGVGRGKSQLTRSHQTSLDLDLEPPAENVQRLRLEFVTPTELKQQGRIAPTPLFPVLMARMRDRIGSLASLPGQIPLELDYRGFLSEAETAEITQQDLNWQHHERKSSRTGQRHPLDGFTGTVTYQGQLGPYLPWLKAGCLTGVGRQTVWGKGQYRILSMEE